MSYRRINTRQFFFKYMCCAFFLLSFSQGNAQLKQEYIEEIREAISKLDFLLGSWEGDATVFFREGKRQLYQTELVQLKLGATIIQIDGKGYASKAKEKALFQAMAIISYDYQSDKYILHAFKDGTFIEVELSLLEDNSLQWQQTIPNGIKRNTFYLKDDQWIEKGEFSSDGVNFIEIFTMNLKKTT